MNPTAAFVRRRLLATVILVWLHASLQGAGEAGLQRIEREFTDQTLPFLKEYCLGCHSTEKHKGDLDLERATSFQHVFQQPKVWQGVLEQLALGEMPPKDKPQPNPVDRERFVAWVNSGLEWVANTRAGDPGPVILRRLSNAEYTYTLRDLTGVPSLDPAREFPVDSASGEGFMNVGNSLVMSPSLVTKFLEAAKDVASHAVLLPDGFAFSASTSPRDWTDEKLAAIRGFYARFTDNGGGSAVNLQGIQFDTKDGGVLPLPKYLKATLELRDRAEPALSIPSLAAAHGLSPKYLNTLFAALTTNTPSLLLDPLRERWRRATAAEVPALAGEIVRWQQALWRFTQVGHIGKRDGPKAWQVPVVSLASAREVRLKLPRPADGADVTLYLAASDAGDGNTGDFALWENPRIVAGGRPDVALRDLRTAVGLLADRREKLLRQTGASLAAVAEIRGSPAAPDPVGSAQRHGVDPEILAAWLECLGIGVTEARIEGHLTQKLESAQNYDFIQGWTGADALSVLANSSTQAVRVPGNMKAQGVAVHPAPKRRVLVGWRSPVDALLHIGGQIQHAHPECGNGVTWSLELRRGSTRQRLAAGTSQGAKAVVVGPLENIRVQMGDTLAVVIGPRDGNHSCDLTAVDLRLTAGDLAWDLGKDVSPDILAGNPHADRLGHPAVWHFYSEPDLDGPTESMLPADSFLAHWLAATNSTDQQQWAMAVVRLLGGGTNGLTPDAPNSVLYRQLTSLNGPLMGSVLRPATLAAGAARVASPGVTPPGPGLDPAMFGHHPNGSSLGSNNLCLQAPAVVAVRIPAELAAGAEFVATARLHAGTGGEGSVQMQALTNEPAATLGLSAGPARIQGGKSTWSDGERPVISDSPILVTEVSTARKRIEAALDEFRQLFPAALCYTKIVPVDEVVTLTLYYREDDHLRRLMLDEAQTAELDRLWTEMNYISQAPLKLVDAFEQLWQFATQDADPSAFTPMREPIKQRAEEFKRSLLESQPTHLEAILRWADLAYRRPLLAGEKTELRDLYTRLRAEDLPHEQAVRLTLARVLMAPAFLYRAEKSGPGERAVPVDNWELATRLSYFLWSAAPDAELRAAAASGRLHEPDVLARQTRRMLQDPRVRRLATEFACVWLHLYEFDQLDEKSERHFPTFAGLRSAMYEETIRFFTDLFQRDGPVRDILDADYAFLNENLAAHYDIPNVKGTEWRRVDGVKKYSRGGILGQATVLAKQSGASRTSPILRGNWLCEVLLGEKLPRPPKDVPRLPEDEATETMTMRQLTEKHSSDPKCSGCHRRIDAYGFSLEAFDAIGRRRDHDLAGHPINTRAKVMDGTELEDLDGLRNYLLTRRSDAFLKQFCRKLLGYALGRGILLSDGPLISRMRDELKAHEYRFSAALETIVRSPQFLEIRGKDMAGDE